MKWQVLHEKYLNLIKKSKSSYAKKIVGDLKSSNPSQWYSKVKRMSNVNRDGDRQHYIEELSELNTQEQADTFVKFYATTRNQFEPVHEDDFLDVLQNDARQNVAELLTTPDQIEKIILGMNRKSACIDGDIPFKVIHFFSEQLSKPLCIIYNSMFIDAKYPKMWKTEYITPVEKCFPASKIQHFRPISGLLSFAKISDKLIASYIIEDMVKDNKQYGNEKGLSINHYLVKMIHKILKSVDDNSNTEKKSVILTMLDSSQAFERQSHFLGIKSFIDNKVRLSLIPTLISFFQARKLTVKWKNVFSKIIEVAGGGPQGGKFWNFRVYLSNKRQFRFFAR